MGQEADKGSRGVASAGALAFARLLCNAVRLPILACFIILEPLVSFVLTTLALIGMLTALFLEFVVELPQFPFWFVLGGSAGCAVLLLAYYVLCAVLGSMPKWR